jgi:hypothetical protein
MLLQLIALDDAEIKILLPNWYPGIKKEKVVF